MKQVAKFLIGMCLLFAGLQSASAVNYTPSVLNNPPFPAARSCYSYLTRTVATSPTLVGFGEENVGVMCFRYTSGTTGTVTDGHLRDKAGVTILLSHCPSSGTNGITGTYGFALANLPYYGGGWINLAAGNPAGCMDDYDIVVNSVSGGLAGGFQLIKKAVTPNPNALVLGGTAFYQGPEPATTTFYTAGVLTGCYSFLSESVLTSPVPAGPGKDLLGAVCFSGGTGVTGTLTFGRVRDVNGVISSINNPNGLCIPCTGSYAVNSVPGYGMGTLTIGTTLTFAFAPFGVGIPAPGVAEGFQFTLINPASPAGSRIEGGTAYFQQ